MSITGYIEKKRVKPDPKRIKEIRDALERPSKYKDLLVKYFLEWN